MAVTASAIAYALLSSCDATSAGGTWSGGNAITTETDFFKYSSACIAYTTRQTTTYQLNFSPTTSLDLSGTGSTIVRQWFMSFQQFADQASDGIRFYISDGSNTAYWNVLGGDTYGGGWVLIAVDVSTTQTSGTKPNMSAVTDIGLDVTTTGTTKNAPSTYIDHLHVSDGMSVYGNIDAVTPFGMNEAYDADNTTSTAWGFVKKSNGVYFLSGAISIGDTGANDTEFSDADEVYAFDGSIMQDGGFGITTQQGTGATEVDLTRCIIKSSNIPFAFDATDPINGNSLIDGVSFINGVTQEFDASRTITNSTFVACNAVYPNGAVFENNRVTTTTETTFASLYLDTLATISACANITFSEYTGKYAVYIPASVTGTITLTGFIGDGSGTDVYWLGTTGTLTINKAGGTNFSTWDSAGTGTSGNGDVLIVASVDIDVNVKDQQGSNLVGALVYIDEDLGSAGNIVNTTTDVNGDISTSYSGVATTATVRVRLYGYKPFVGTIGLGSNSSTNVVLITDPQQT